MKKRLVVYLEPKKVEKVKRIAKAKKWDITVFLEEGIDLAIAEYEGK